MSIKSTHRVTRQFAKEVIERKLSNVDDNQLANILEEVIHNGFYNFMIVSEEELAKEKKSEWGLYLDDVYNLPVYNDAY